ncbi:MAG: BirA family transcriptional regulator, biotin operon repressor / biotin-acetyl-CoA-carboxylase ligase [Gallionellaceae bacterium]|nr:MAG: BirA family transcriptional regulator, biotin operon repressor / biotin-acetyl-CoA-carboxylase ligase [Gallionellaceae bacterium]
MMQSENTPPKPLTFALLKQLADGDFHSGEEMGHSLGLTRTSVHNALQDVAQFGLKLHSVRGRGYQLAQPLYWLEGEKISAYLGEASEHLNLVIAEHAESSNAVLLERARHGAVSGSVLAVEWQSAGRGRLGRRWHSGLGDALTFSLLWRFDKGLAALSGLSLAVGVAMVRALRELGVNEAGLKWPNDVLLPDGKLAGILLEAQGDMLGPSAVVIGVGMNLSLPSAARKQIDQPVSDLVSCGVPLHERNRVFAVLLRHLVSVLQAFALHGFAALRAEWEGYHRLQQCAALVHMPDGSHIEGIVLGVDDEGALRMRTQRGEQVFHAGEISLRKA